MDLVAHIIGNYSMQDLFVAGRMLRKAAQQYAASVSPHKPQVHCCRGQCALCCTQLFCCTTLCLELGVGGGGASSAEEGSAGEHLATSLLAATADCLH